MTDGGGGAKMAAFARPALHDVFYGPCLK